MRVLQITAWDTVGERFNGSLIHQALLERGHESAMLVRYKTGDDPRTREAGTSLTRFVDNRLLNPLQERLSLQAMLSTSASTVFLTDTYRRADIIHLHVIHGSPFFSLLNLPLMNHQKRVVWTLHDPWPLTGHCIYPGTCELWRSGCGNCPDLDRSIPMRKDRSSLMWHIKSRIIARSNISLVVASRYMRQIVADSPILQNLKSHLIPFGLPTHIFRPNDRTDSRANLKIPTNADVIAFRFRGTEERHKGGRGLVRALQIYSPDRPTVLLVLESSDAIEGLNDKYTVRRMGWVNDPSRLADIFRAADIFLMPSEEEAFGVMAIESMACGTPVIVCDGTALPEVVMAPEGGIAVPKGDGPALAAALGRLLDAPEARRRLGERAAVLAREHYSAETYINRHIALYESLLGDEK